MFTTPFRGSTAVAAGLLTPGELRGPRFRRLFRDVYVLASVEVDLALLAYAAHVLVRGVGVIGGWAAAELLNASCGPADAPAEIIVPIRRRTQPGLLVRHEAIPEPESRVVGGVLVTDERRTAWDLGRRRRSPAPESFSAGGRPPPSSPPCRCRRGGGRAATSAGRRTRR